MPQKLTKFEYEYQKESIEQEIRGLDIAILENKRTIKENELEASNWDVEKSKETIRKAKLGYETAKVGNDITEEKLNQLKDQLDFERFNTYLNREHLAIGAKNSLLALAEAKQELENNSALFELRYRTLPDLEALPKLGGNS